MVKRISQIRTSEIIMALGKWFKELVLNLILLNQSKINSTIHIEDGIKIVRNTRGNRLLYFSNAKYFLMRFHFISMECCIYVINLY